MKVFVSWSKPASRAVAQLFTDWLPKVIQECRAPYFSVETDKGDAWFQAITQNLQDSKIGVVFITRENLREEWIHFEAGAIYAALDKRVFPILVGISKTDYDGPLSNLQLTEALDQEDMWRLVRGLNRNCDVQLEEGLLQETFNHWWPELHDGIASALNSSVAGAPPVPKRSLEEKVDELLLLVREGARQSTGQEARREREERQRKHDLKVFIAEHGGQFAFRDGELYGEVTDVRRYRDPVGDGVSTRIRIKHFQSGDSILAKPNDFTFSDVPF